MFEDAGLACRNANRQRVTVGSFKLDHIGAVGLWPVDHDAISAGLRCYTHRQRSFPHSSSASRFTAGAVFFILSQSGERPERYIESFRFDTMPSRPSLQAWAK